MTAEHETTDKTRQLIAPLHEDPNDVQCACDAEQRELWVRYLEQQARRSCPSCGEPDDAVL